MCTLQTGKQTRQERGLILKARGMQMRKVLFRLGVVILIITLLCSGYCIWIDNHLVITKYTLQTSFKKPIRIVQLTDLHNKKFGKNNRKLVSMVRNQNPDLVVMTGDMLNATEEETETVSSLIAEMAKFSQVYYGYGNHEVKWLRNYNVNLQEMLEKQGAVVVNNSYVDIDIKGQPLRIGGYMGYYRAPHMLTHDEEGKKIEWEFAENFEQTDRYKVLLNHIPTQWVDWHYTNKYDVDLVFSGHYHGGVIQIPFINRGLIAPYVGWFPKNTKGVFFGEKGICILSVGLGSEYSIPRVNNPPEIVIADLLPL